MPRKRSPAEQNAYAYRRARIYEACHAGHFSDLTAMFDVDGFPNHELGDEAKPGYEDSALHIVGPAEVVFGASADSAPSITLRREPDGSLISHCFFDYD